MEAADSPKLCGLFYDCHYRDYIASNDSMKLNNELERTVKEEVVAYSRYYRGSCFKGLRENTNMSVILVGVLAEIRIVHLISRSLQHYPHTTVGFCFSN
jgi:hypothetical protein